MSARESLGQQFLPDEGEQDLSVSELWKVADHPIFEEDYAPLAQRLRRGALKNRIKVEVYHQPEGHPNFGKPAVYIDDGNHRLAAFRHLGRESIPASVRHIQL